MAVPPREAPAPITSLPLSCQPRGNKPGATCHVQGPPWGPPEDGCPGVCGLMLLVVLPSSPPLLTVQMRQPGLREVK